MLEQQYSELQNYRLTKPCHKNAVVDLRNQRYLEKNKIRFTAGSYQKRVALRRITGADLDVEVIFQRRVQDHLFTRLERLSKRGEIESFVRALHRVKWENRRVTDFARAIRLALNVSAPTAARHMFTLGQKYHAKSPQLSAYEKLFGKSPRASIRTFPANNTLKANREWLKENRATYRGQWIALREGNLIGVGSSLDDLKSRVSDVSNTLLTRA